MLTMFIDRRNTLSGSLQTIVQKHKSSNKRVFKRPSANGATRSVFKFATQDGLLAPRRLPRYLGPSQTSCGQPGGFGTGQVVPP